MLDLRKLRYLLFSADYVSGLNQSVEQLYREQSPTAAAAPFRDDVATPTRETG
ncbi:hypothetical protein SAMN05421862_117110 [Pseudomonas extremaustralis]|uniref:hypothetical protein n=1 Tax=Pseudomonas extremaustralis TaxID=359110 RepID=UPI0009D5947F|nr:hypothetical protein [Pseudomonas extremaustralis]SKB01739.1 hypothetical protein SAMN05421862_117110 [Pseudomonas extremaustralis]